MKSALHRNKLTLSFVIYHPVLHTWNNFGIFVKDGGLFDSTQTVQ
jgi:hypothetical protein